MTTNPARVVVLAAAAALVVCGCASVKITAPATDAVVMLPSNTAPTTVAVTSSSNISNLMVTADGTDVSNQVYHFTNRAVAASGANWGCLTEGSGGTLIQSNCSDTTDRLWSVFNNGLNSFEAGNMPW